MNKCVLFSGKHNGMASVEIAISFMKEVRRTKRGGKSETE
jgi:hypothetical protein